MLRGLNKLMMKYKNKDKLWNPVRWATVANCSKAKQNEFYRQHPSFCLLTFVNFPMKITILYNVTRLLNLYTIRMN